MSYSNTKNKTNRKAVNFYKFKMLKNGNDYYFSSNLALNLKKGKILDYDDEQIQYSLLDFDIIENLLCLYLAKSVINKDVPVSSTKIKQRSENVEQMSGVDEAHFFIGIKNNKLWIAKTIAPCVISEKILCLIFKLIFNENINFQLLPNLDVIQEIKTKGIQTHGFVADIDPNATDLPNGKLMELVKTLKDKIFNVKFEYTRRDNSELIDKLSNNFDQECYQSLNGGSYIKIKGDNRKITADDVVLRKTFYFEEYKTTRSISRNDAFACLRDMDY